MYREPYSYWLTARTDDSKQAISPNTVKDLQKLVRSRFEGQLYLSDGLPANKPVHEVCFEVDPDEGTCDQIDNAFEDLAYIGKQYPELVFELKELNEEDKSEQRLMVVSGGKTATDQYARLVPCDSKYDRITVDDVAAFVADLDPVIAAKIRATFHPLSETCD